MSLLLISWQSQKGVFLIFEKFKEIWPKIDHSTCAYKLDHFLIASRPRKLVTTTPQEDLLVGNQAALAENWRLGH